MNVLQLVPGLAELADRFITTDQEKQEFLAQASKLRIEQMEAENDRFSLMAGPLRLILYGLAVYFFAVWLGPVLGIQVPPLPEEMYNVCRWIIAFVIPSEAFTINDIQLGNFRSPSGRGLFDKGVKK